MTMKTAGMPLREATKHRGQLLGAEHRQISIYDRETARGDFREGAIEYQPEEGKSKDCLGGGDDCFRERRSTGS